MKIGILVTGHVPDEMRDDYSSYAPLFENLLKDQGFDFRAWSVVDMEFPMAPSEADGWLITGSKHGAYEDHPFIPPLEHFIRQAYTEDVPLVGVCFGHQVIAQALGGKVEKFDGGWAVGRQKYEVAGKTMSLNAWHQDQVTKCPTDAKVIGGNAFCKNAALVYGHKAFTVQPHPEFKSDFVSGLMEYRGSVIPNDLLKPAKDQLDDPIDDDAFSDMISSFFKTREIH